MIGELFCLIFFLRRPFFIIDPQDIQKHLCRQKNVCELNGISGFLSICTCMDKVDTYIAALCHICVADDGLDLADAKRFVYTRYTTVYLQHSSSWTVRLGWIFVSSYVVL